jgi:hypothetical protein
MAEEEAQGVEINETVAVMFPDTVHGRELFTNLYIELQNR